MYAYELVGNGAGAHAQEKDKNTEATARLFDMYKKIAILARDELSAFKEKASRETALEDLKRRISWFNNIMRAKE